MTTIVFHTRYITSDFDESEGPGHLFDADARIGAERAYRQARRHLQTLERSGRGPAWKVIRSKVRVDLTRIARNYWRDFDYDDRKNSAKVKAEAAKLLHPLKNAVAVLEERPPYVRRALNSEAAQSVGASTSEYHDLFTAALAANQALAQACEVFVSRDHFKNGGATRFKNACRELATLWADIFGKKFPLNSKTAPATDRETALGVKRAFVSPGAAFVYLTLHEIGNRWVTVSQVAEAIDAMKGGK